VTTHLNPAEEASQAVMVPPWAHGGAAVLRDRTGGDQGPAEEAPGPSPSRPEDELRAEIEMGQDQLIALVLSGHTFKAD